jgi:rootletin
LEKKLQQNLFQLGNEKDNEINQLQQRIEELQHHLETLCQQHEEILLRAENDKQQALLLGKPMLNFIQAVYKIVMFS